MNRSSSTRLTLWPIPRISSLSVLIVALFLAAFWDQTSAGVSVAAALVLAAAWIALTMFM